METSGSPTGRDAGLSATFWAEQRRTWRRWLNVPRVLARACDVRVGATPYDVVLEHGTHRLIRYRRQTRATYAEPVLLCYALVNRPYILDLQPDKSVVRQYLARGFEVYLIDWGVPSDADKSLTLAHYIFGFLARAVGFILQSHRSDRPLHLLGYCMGGTMAALFAACNPDRVATLGLLAAPIDFDTRESLLNVWAQQGNFDVDALIDAYGNCPAWFLQTCFLSLSPIQNGIEKTLSFYEQMDDLRGVSNHFALERWLSDNIPVAGEAFREFVKKLYQRNELVKGELRLGDRRVDLRRITCPLLLLTAAHDHLVPPSSTVGIKPHVSCREIESKQIAAGHVGLVIGSKAQKTFWPEATRWLAEHSTSI